MQQGDVVTVKLASREMVRMTVWERLEDTTLVCRPEAYSEAKRSKGEPRTVEFSNHFVAYVR